MVCGVFLNVGVRLSMTCSLRCNPRCCLSGRPGCITCRTANLRRASMCSGGGVEMAEELEKFWQLKVFQWGISLGKAVVILVLGWLIARIGARLLARGLRRVRLEATLVPFLSSLLYALILVIVVVT